MYFIFNFILQNLIFFYCLLTSSFCLTPKHPRTKLLIPASIIAFFIYVLKFCYFDSQILLPLSSILIQILSFLFTILCFNDSVYKRIIVFTVVEFCNIISELVGLTFLNLLSSYTLVLEPQTKEFTMAIILTLPIQIILNLIFIFFWKYLCQRRKFGSILIFSLVPTLQLFCITLTYKSTLAKNTDTSNIIIEICSFVSLAATIYLLYLVLRRQEKQSLEEAYLELKALYDLENEYYHALEAYNEELAKIRHDYNNQLSTLYMLISTNQIETAKELASSIINHTL